MTSENPEPQESASKNTQKQEEEETNNMPAQEKEAIAKQGLSNPPSVILLEQDAEDYHLFQLPAGGPPHIMSHKPKLMEEGLVIGSLEGGWLIHYGYATRLTIFVSGYENQVLINNFICLLNPLSGEKRRLPAEPRFVPRRLFKVRFVAEVITSNCSPDSPEFLTVAFFWNSSVFWLAFCRIEDKSWTHIADVKLINCHDKTFAINPALALDDKTKLLYFLHLNPSFSNYDLMVFDLKDSSNVKMKRLVMAESNTLPTQGIFARVKREAEKLVTNLNFGDRRLYLVADSSCGDLFMVLQKNDADLNVNILPVESYRVFIKVDEGKPQWKEIHDLGDRSIYISHSCSSRMIYTAEFNFGSESEKEFFRGNCIYFSLQNVYDIDKISLKRDIGVFSLTDRSIRHFHLPPKFQKNPVATLWFNPRST